MNGFAMEYSNSSKVQEVIMAVITASVMTITTRHSSANPCAAHAVAVTGNIKIKLKTSVVLNRKQGRVHKRSTHIMST